MADEVLVRCLCGRLSFNAKLKCTLPYKGTMCHCNICRHVTGALTFTGIGPIDISDPSFSSNLTSYATSKNITRYFCPECGSHAVYHVDNRWMVCPGAIDEVVKGGLGTLEEITGHEFVADTGDGGLSWLVPDAPYYLGADDEPPVKNIRSALQEQGNDTKKHEDQCLVAQCHCGKVKLNIGRPDDGGKWKGGICVCRSCRLALSQTLVPWLSNIPMEKIKWSDGFEYNSSAEKYIKRYNSSLGTWRDFCSTCGASVAWHSEKEAGQLDVAAGILRSEDGALARSWIEWSTTDVHFKEDAIDLELVKIVEKNLNNLC